MTPLYLVAQNGRKEFVKLLLTNEADIFVRNNHDTVLHRAVGSNILVDRFFRTPNFSGSVYGDKILTILSFTSYKITFKSKRWS